MRNKEDANGGKKENFVFARWLNGRVEAVTENGLRVEIIRYNEGDIKPIIGKYTLLGEERESSWTIDGSSLIMGNAFTGSMNLGMDLHLVSSPDSMKRLIINKETVSYIKENKHLFDIPVPQEGDIWSIESERSYVNVNNGEPVLNLIGGNGEWMRIPRKVAFGSVDVELTDDEKKIASLVAEALTRLEFDPHEGETEEEFKMRMTRELCDGLSKLTSKIRIAKFVKAFNTMLDMLEDRGIIDPDNEEYADIYSVSKFMNEN